MPFTVPFTSPPLSGLFQAIQHSPVGSTISASTWMFPTIETIHVMAIATVVGTIVMVDLRLVGVASKERPVSGLTHDLLPWTWGAFALALTTGLLLFSSQAADYMAVPAFVVKFGFMALAAANMAIFHLATWRSLDRWDVGPPAPAARVAGVLSLALWAAVVVCGRKVGFSL